MTLYLPNERKTILPFEPKTCLKFCWLKAQESHPCESGLEILYSSFESGPIHPIIKLSIRPKLSWGWTWQLKWTSGLGRLEEHLYLAARNLIHHPIAALKDMKSNLISLAWVGLVDCSMCGCNSKYENKSFLTCCPWRHYIRMYCRNPLDRHVTICLNLSRHPSMGHEASLHLCLDVFHQLGTSSPDSTVNSRLPHDLPRLHDAFQIGSLTVFYGQSFFFPSKACSMRHPHVFSGSLSRFALCRLQNKAISEMLGRTISNLYQPLKK